VLGIDIGGSKTHGVRAAGGIIVAEARSGSANPSSVGPPEALRQLDALLSTLGTDGIDAVCAGAAGVEGDEAEERLRRLLVDRLPAVPVRVVHDTELVLAAAGLDEGAVVISGTGSSAWGRTAGGRRARAGGWGYLLGDIGGGYGVMRAAIQHALDRADDGEAADALTERLLAAGGTPSVTGLLDRFYATPSRRSWAARSGLVFELAAAGDPAAARIIAATAAELVQAVERVCRRLGIRGPVVMAGGLVRHQPLLQDEVRAGLRRHGITDVQVLADDPVLGAVRLAEQLLPDGLRADGGAVAS
jgi:N-acetylglucosamine kinase-like BadF-type ATPase